MMAKKIVDFQIIDNKQLNNDFFILELSSETALHDILPGQFVQVRIDGSSETFLRRPFSVHDVDYSSNSIKLLIQVAGKGTKKLSQMAAGGTLNLILPLGNSFSLPYINEKSLLIGGGCWIAPLLYLAKYLKSKSCEFDILMGFRNRNRIIEYDEYKKLSNVYLTTEDGSEGEKGFVTDNSILIKNKYNRIYCCGPDLMMKAVASYSAKNSINCEVSLENLMACGIGVCLCCVVDTTRGNVCSCTDGPVFNIKDLKW
jgi:dihydroorotate dehydrogenase electron transfer subunit